MEIDILIYLKDSIIRQIADGLRAHDRFWSKNGDVPNHDSSFYSEILLVLEKRCQKTRKILNESYAANRRRLEENT